MDGSEDTLAPQEVVGTEIPAEEGAAVAAEPTEEQQQLERELASLSPEDREFLLTAQRTARMNRIQEQMQGMTAEDVATALGTVAPAKAKKTA